MRQRPLGTEGAALDAAAAELAALVGLKLDPADRDAVAAMLGRGEDGRWTNIEYTCGDVAAVARALAGFLLLDEDVLWTSGRQLGARGARGAFRRVVDLLRDGNVLGEGGVPVKVRFVNGDEGLCRLDTGRRMSFAGWRRGGVRGRSVDLLIVDEDVSTEERDDLIPALAATPNPQLVTVQGRHL